jgi:hypothetical protein
MCVRERGERQRKRKGDSVYAKERKCLFVKERLVYVRERETERMCM